MTNLTEQYRELEQDFFAYQKMLNEANKDLNKYYLENTKLKELLKECKHIMSIEKDFASCHFEKDRLCKILTKINQVLGEE